MKDIIEIQIEIRRLEEKSESLVKIIRGENDDESIEAFNNYVKLDAQIEVLKWVINK